MLCLQARLPARQFKDFGQASCSRRDWWRAQQLGWLPYHISAGKFVCTGTGVLPDFGVADGLIFRCSRVPAFTRCASITTSATATA